MTSSLSQLSDSITEAFLYTFGKFLLKSADKVLTRGLIPYSRSISRARSPAELAAELKRRETAYSRSIRSAVFLASKTNCSNPSLAVRHASLQALPDLMLSAKRSKSPRWKDFTCSEGAAREVYVRRWGEGVEEVNLGGAEGHMKLQDFMVVDRTWDFRRAIGGGGKGFLWLLFALQKKLKIDTFFIGFSFFFFSCHILSLIDFYSKFKGQLLIEKITL